MVRWRAAGELEYAALIDWDAAGWCDPAWDFSGVPPSAALTMLAGHRELAPLVEDETAEARILWSHLQLALFGLHRGMGDWPAWRIAGIVRRLLSGVRFFVGATYLRDLGPPGP